MIIHTKDGYKQCKPLRCLGDIYVKRGESEKCTERFVQAIGLYNAALARIDEEHKADRTEILSRIKETECIFLNLLGSSLHRKIKTDTSSCSHSDILDNLRTYCLKEIDSLDKEVFAYDAIKWDSLNTLLEENRISKIRGIYSHVTSEIKKLVGILVDECIRVIGDPPCKLSMVAFGSLARMEMTPYSDLEFGILLQSGTTYSTCIKEYFHALTMYLHLKIVNIGETILPSLAIPALNDFYSDNNEDNWFYDSYTKRGFAFDGAMPHACKTPVGRRETNGFRSFELIGTPDYLSQYLINDPTENDPGKSGHLGTTLLNYSWLYGEKGIFEDFAKMIRRRLSSEVDQHETHIDEDFAGLTFGQSLAKDLLHSDVSRYETDIERRDLSGKQFTVKTEIYRLPITVVNGLAMLYDTHTGSAWDVIERLYKAGKLSNSAQHNLQMAVTIASELRLRTYLAKDRQGEQSATVPKFTGNDALIINDKLKDMLMKRFFSTIIPFEIETKRLLKTNTPQNVFQGDLYDDSNLTKGMICLRLFRLEEAEEYFTDEIQILKAAGAPKVKIFNVLNTLAYVKNELSYLSEAKCLYEECREISALIGDEKDRDEAVYTALNNVGMVYYHEGQFLKAKDIFLDCYETQTKRKGTNSCKDFALAASNLGAVLWELAEYEKAGKLFKEALSVRLHLKSNFANNPGLIGSYNNLSGYFAEIGQHSEALRYNTECLKIVKLVYGDNVCHPAVAAAVRNTGTILGRLGCYKEAFKYAQLSLNMYMKIFPGTAKNMDIMRATSSLAVIYGQLGDEEKAIAMWENILDMSKDENGCYEESSFVGNCLDNLGVAYRAFRHDKENGIKCHETAHGILKRCNSEEDIKCVNVLNNLGRAQENEDKSLAFYYDALKILHSTFGKNSNHPRIIATTQFIGEAYRDKGNMKTGIQYLMKAHNMIGTREEGSDNAQMASSYLTLAKTEQIKGNYTKALELATRSLEMNRTFYKEENSLVVANSLTTIADIYKSNMFYEDAKAYYEDAYTTIKNLYRSGDHPTLCESITQLAYICLETKSYERALAYAEQASSMQERLDTQKRSNYYSHFSASIMQLFGDYYMTVKEANNALSTYEKLLRYREEFFPKTHKLVGKSLTNIGEVYVSLGRYDEAKIYYTEALQITTMQHPNMMHPDFITLYTHMADCQCHTSNYVEALDSMRQALSCADSLFEKEANVYTAQILHGMSIIHCRDNSLEEALHYSNESYKMKKDIFVDNFHQSLKETLIQLADVHYKMKDFKLACTAYEEVIVKVGKTAAFLEIPIASLSQYAQSLVQLNECSKSLEVYKGVLHREQKAHESDPSHPHVVNLLVTMGKLFYELNDFQEGVILFQSAFNKIQASVIKAEPSSFLLNLLNNLGCGYFKTNQLEKAEENFRESLAMALALTDENDLAVARAKENLAGVLVRNDRFDEAICMLLTVVDIRNVLKSESSSYASTYSNIGMCYFGKKEYAIAIYFYEKAIGLKQTPTDSITDLEYISKSYMHMDDYGNVIMSLSALLEILRDGNEMKKYVSCVKDMALAYEKLGNHNSAITYYNESLELQCQFPSITSRNDRMKDFKCLGFCYFKTEQYMAALDCFKKARQILSNTSLTESTIDHKILIQINNGLACTYAKQEDFNEARQIFQEAFDLCKALNESENDLDIFVEIANNLAEVNRQCGDINAAESCFMSAVQAYTNNPRPDFIPVIESFLGLAKLEEMRGCYGAAEGYIRQGLSLHKTNDTESIPCETVMECHLSLGNILFQQEKYQEAHHQYCYIIESRRKANLSSLDPKLTAPLMNIGSILCKQGKFLQGIVFYMLTDSMLPHDGESDKGAILRLHISTNLGLSYEALNFYSAAAEHHRKALEYGILSSQNLPHYISLHTLLLRAANAYTLSKQFSKATTAYTQLLTLIESQQDKDQTCTVDRSSILTRLTHISLFNGEYNSALRYCEQVLYLKRQKVKAGEASCEVAVAMIRVGYVYHKIGNEAMARVYHSDALAEKLRLIGADNAVIQSLLAISCANGSPYHTIGTSKLIYEN